MEKKGKRGYTLLEILVVILILVALAYLSTPMYNKVIQRSEVSDALNNMSMLSEAQDKYFIGHGSYADNISDLKTPLQSDGDEIITTNFTYGIGDPGEDDYCIYAQNNSKDYTLAKNYRKNSKVLCSGSDCNKVSSFVETGDLDGICSGNSGGCNIECTPPQVLNVEECECEDPPCDKTEESCQEENEHWTLLPGCSCGCPGTGFCRLDEVWNADECECQKTQPPCDLQCANPGDIVDIEQCICSCGKTSIKKCFTGTLLEDCSCDNSCEEQDCPTGKIWSQLSCSCVCETVKKCKGGQVWDSVLCKCVRS